MSLLTSVANTSTVFVLWLWKGQAFLKCVTWSTLNQCSQDMLTHIWPTINSLISLTVRTLLLHPQANDSFCKYLLCVSVMRLEILRCFSGLSSEPNCLHLNQIQLCLFASDQHDQHGWPCWLLTFFYRRGTEHRGILTWVSSPLLPISGMKF